MKHLKLIILMVLTAAMLAGCGGAARIDSSLHKEEIKMNSANIDKLTGIYAVIFNSDAKSQMDTVKKDLENLNLIIRDENLGGLVTEEEIQKGLDSMYALYGGREKFLQNSDLREEDVILFTKLQSYLSTHKERALATVKVTDEEVRTYYQAHIDEYIVAEQVDIQHILVDSKEAAEAALVKINPDGANFIEVAKSVTMDPGSVEITGSSKGSLLEPLEKVIYANQDLGVYRTPIQSDMGWHIINIVSRKTGVTEGFEKVMPVIKENLLQEKRDSFYEDYMRKANGKA